MNKFIIVALLSAFLASIVPAAATNAPTITPGTGSFTTQQSVSMSASAGTIYYTTDGSIPTTSSTVYTTPFVVSNPTQINAIAYSSAVYSAVTTAYIDVDPYIAPILQSGLLVRLKAGFGVRTSPGSPNTVSNWTDLSGNGNDFFGTSGSQPALINFSRNNLPVINFNGSSQFLYAAPGFANFTSGITIFMVVQPTALSSGMHILDFGNVNSGDNILLQVSNTGSYAEFWTYNGTSGTSAQSPVSLTQNQYQLLEAVLSGTNGTVYINGTPGISNSSMNTITNTTRYTNFLGKAINTSNYYSGNIAELLIYSTVLTDAQRQAIEAYLLQKYQLLSVNPRPPIISVPSGILNAPTQVVIAAEPGTVTYVTTDGSTPTTSSPLYTGPLNVYYSQTVKAVSVLNGLSSSVASATYTLDSSQWPAPSSGDTTAPTINLQLPSASL